MRAPKERALLLSLLLHANEVVSSERLSRNLWGEPPPELAAKANWTVCVAPASASRSGAGARRGRADRGPAAG